MRGDYRVGTLGALRTMVVRSGRTKVQISKDLGVSESYISALISRGSIPLVDTLARVADACGYDLSVENRANGDCMTIEPIKQEHFRA